MSIDRRDSNPAALSAASSRPAGVALVRPFLSGIILCAAILAAGCGGCSSSSGDSHAQWGGMTKEEWLKQRQERARQEAREAEEAKKKEELAKEEKRKRREEESRKQAEQRATTVAAKRAREQDPEQEQARQNAERPPLPENFSDWKESDFLQALLLGDPRLAPAVEYYGKQHVGDETAAKFVTQLLERPSSANSPGVATAKGDRRNRLRCGPGNRRSPALAAIVAALGANGTAKARQTLEGLLNGTLPTDDGRAAEAALQALVDHPGPEHDEIMLRMLTTVPPDDASRRLRQQAVALLKASASSNLRLELAEQLMEPAMPEDLRTLLEEIIQEPAPANFEAHVALYSSPRLGREMRAALEREFLAYSSEAMGWRLRLAERRGRFASDSQWPCRVAQHLWNPPFQVLLERRLEQGQSLSEIAPALLLATTIPAASMRSLVFRTLERHWTDGPDALAAAGYPMDVISDPGLLLVLKALLRRDGVSAPASRSGRYGEIVRARLERDARLAGRWSTAAQELAESMCSRFQAAGKADADTTRRQGGAADFGPALQDLPLELPADAPVVAALRYAWPAGIGEDISSAADGPVLIHCVRIEMKAEPRQVVGLYRRRVARAEVREIDNGAWLDSFTTGVSGDKRSLDVFVRALDPDPLRLPNEPQDLAVEILSVRLDGPAPSAGP